MNFRYIHDRKLKMPGDEEARLHFSAPKMADSDPKNEAPRDSLYANKMELRNNTSSQFLTIFILFQNGRSRSEASIKSLYGVVAEGGRARSVSRL